MKSLVTPALFNIRLLKILAVGSVLALFATMPSMGASNPESAAHWVRANGVSLRYQLFGKGTDTIVLLHESLMALESWDYIAPELAKTHRVLRYDLRGFGLSQAIKEPFTLDDDVADLRELLKVLNIHGKVHLVGVAVGGAIALKFAADEPNLVADVIAISPAAYLQGHSMSAMAPLTPAAQSTTGAQASPDEPAEASNEDKGPFPSAMRKAGPARYEQFEALRDSAAAANGGDKPTITAIYAVRYSEVLPTIRVPTVIAATSLWIRPVAEYKALADAIPNSRFEVLKTGHYAALASPDLVIALVRKYIK